MITDNELLATAKRNTDDIKPRTRNQKLGAFLLQAVLGLSVVAMVFGMTAWSFIIATN